MMLETRRAVQHNAFGDQAPLKTSTANPTRRSLSIFSRKGADTAEPIFLSARSYTAPFVPISSAAAAKKSPKPKKGKGTVINAVPQASAVNESVAIAVAVAVTGADSIDPAATLRSEIKESSPLEFACATAYEEATTLKDLQDIVIAQQADHKRGLSKSGKTEERIGVWVDGIIHWDDKDKKLTRSSWERAANRSSMERFASLRQRRRSESAVHSKKPSLTVVIPGEALTKDSDASYPPELKRPVTQIAISTRPKTSSGSRKRRTVGFPVHDVSPMSSATTSPRKSGSIKTTIFTPVDGHSRAASAASHRVDPSRSSSTASSSVKDDRSIKSARSSSTSVDGKPLRSALRHKASSGSVHPMTDPLPSTVFDESQYTPVTRTYANKPLPPVPGMADVMRLNPLPPPLTKPPTSESPAKRPQTARGPPSATSLRSFPKPPRLPSTLRHMKSVSKLDRFDEEFMKTSPYVPAEDGHSSAESSPTLSAAEDELEEHLEHLSKHISGLNPLSADTIESSESGLLIQNLALPPQSQLVVEDGPADRRCSVAIVMQPPSRPPTIHESDWRKDTHAAPKDNEVASIPTRRLSDPASLMTPINDAPPGDWWNAHRLSRCVSSPTLPKFHLPATTYRKDRPFNAHQHAIDDGLIVVSGPMQNRIQHGKNPSQGATQQAAEGVLMRILSALKSVDDLMNTVIINRGMYRVFSENRMKLLRRVTFNQSPSSWELMEWRPPVSEEQSDSDEDEIIPEHTPSTYMQTLKQNKTIVAELKTLILGSCTSFIRRDTVAALANANHPQAQRLTDAFWRIWSFCNIFGCQKGRDEDMSGQLDWLKGGHLASNLDCAATVITNFEFDVGSILLNAPDYFGQGNTGGLTADELYDITEAWTCLATLLQGYLGRVDQAREYGVYENCDIPAKQEQKDKDEQDKVTEKEEYMLEEWIAWILTLGPTVVLELAHYASDSSSAGFALAKEKGWTKWAPPTQTTSRVTFLKEPVARLYEERVTTANAKAKNAREQEEKDKSRRRIAAHAQEIRMRRQNSAFKRVPLVDMSMERPMSIMSTLSANPIPTPRFPPPNMTLPPVPKLDLVHPALRSSPSLTPPMPSYGGHQAPTSTPPVGTMLTPPMSPPQFTALPHRAPTPEERADGASREALRAFNGLAESTVEIAIKRIMDMGFSDAQAKHALKVTDTGDGLRVDRAVELLLRSQSPASTDRH